MIYRAEYYNQGRMTLTTAFLANDDRHAVRRALDGLAYQDHIDGWRLFEMPGWREVFPVDEDWR